MLPAQRTRDILLNRRQSEMLRIDSSDDLSPKIRSMLFAELTVPEGNVSLRVHQDHIHRVFVLLIPF